jgi:hypothetical protein
MAATLNGSGAIGAAQPRGSIRMGATLGGGVATYARLSRLVSGYANLTGTGVIASAQPRSRLRLSASIKVNELSQDDVTGAVLEAPVEGGLSLKAAIRLLLAVAQGNATGLDGNPVFRSLDGTKTRVAGTRSGGTRTITTRDAT